MGITLAHLHKKHQPYHFLPLEMAIGTSWCLSRWRGDAVTPPLSHTPKLRQLTVFARARNLAAAATLSGAPVAFLATKHLPTRARWFLTSTTNLARNHIFLSKSIVYSLDFVANFWFATYFLVH